MLKIIDVLKLSYDGFRLLFKEEKYKNLIQRKMKIIISMALSGNINAKGVYLIERIGDEPIEKDIDEFLSGINMKWCEMNRGGDFSQFTFEEAAENMRKIKPGETLMFREFVLTDYCGYATWNKDGNIFIEVRKGGFYSFWEAKETPTHYIVNREKKFLLADERVLKFCTSYDYKNRMWNRNSESDGEKVCLTEQEVTEIAETLINVCKVYRNAKIAWIKSGDEVVVFDIWIMFNQGILE